MLEYDREQNIVAIYLGGFNIHPQVQQIICNVYQNNKNCENVKNWEQNVECWNISGWFEYSSAGAEEKLGWAGSLTGTFANHHIWSIICILCISYILCILCISFICVNMYNQHSHLEGRVWNPMHWHFWIRGVQFVHEENLTLTDSLWLKNSGTKSKDKIKFTWKSGL